MSDKTISKRLREWADRGEECSESPISIAEDDLGLLGDDIIREADLLRVIAEEADADMREGNNASARHIMTNWAEYNDMPMLEGETIGEWLNRWFIPRPRFEDGEPVQFGDEYESDIGGVFPLEQLHCIGDGEYVLNRKGRRALIKPGGFVKRPDTKVLDADGVEIKVGDEGWSNYGSFKKRVIKAVHPAGTWQDAPVDSVEFDDGGWDYAHTFTHREPDSLEKLRDAMKDSMSNEVRVYANRLTALIERGA